MDPELERKLLSLNEDYRTVSQKEPRHFFCPILYRDEDVELCKAHIINQAFPQSDRTWTVQRADVDGRFGSILEAEFVKLQYRGKHTGLDALADPELARRLRPKFTVDGKEVPHFVPCGPIPDRFSPIVAATGSGPVPLVFKMSPDELLATIDSNWQIEIEADIRVHALGALLKAAHLTLFERLGYTYALSAGGHFLGRTVLGDFYDAVEGLPRVRAIELARDHFAPFVNLVRPAPSPPTGLKGTVSDGLLYLCMYQDGPWAIAVLVRTGEHAHMVLIPVFEDAERSARFLRFLEEPSPVFEATLSKYSGSRWEVSPRSRRFHWPKASLA